MGTTTNYQLYITEAADNPKFLEWRNALCGSEDSNMTKIDVALAGKAEKSQAVETVLSAAAWTGTEAPFTQVLSVSDLGATQNGSIALSPTATAAEREAARSALLCVLGQTENALTIGADGDLPNCDIPVVILKY